MFWLLIACTVGSTGPASPSSSSAVEAKNMAQLSEKSGALSNTARELEAASRAARQRIENGADPSTETENLSVIMQRIEQLEAEIQTEHAAMQARIRQHQSTEDTRE